MQEAKPILDPYSNTMHIPFGTDSVTVHTPMRAKCELVSRSMMRKMILRKDTLYLAMTYELFDTANCSRLECNTLSNQECEPHDYA